MKNKTLAIILVTVLLSMAFNSKIKAQVHRDGRKNIPDKQYDISEIALMKADNNNQGLLYGENTTKAIQVLGQPASITDQYFEIDEATAKVYHYD